MCRLLLFCFLPLSRCNTRAPLCILRQKLVRSSTHLMFCACALAHALLAILDIIAGEEGRQRRAHLAALVAQWNAGLQLQRWQALPSLSAIQPVIIGENAEMMAIAATLYEQGLWVGAIRPPTVPAGTARLRVTLSAGHTAPEVAQLINAVNTLERTRHEP